ncbi:MAG: glycosyltransferase family 4 protein, partial [Candidatus Hadarchaeales archaeon]
MRILHINPFFYPYQGGTENYLYELCKRLSKRHSVSVVTSRLAGTKEIDQVEGTKVYRLKALVLKKLPAFLPPPLAIPLSFKKNLVEICKRERPDIIHLHNRFFINFAAVAFWKDELGAPLFLTLHNARPVGISEEIDFWGQLYDDLAGERIMLRCDWVIANSKWTLDITLPKEYPREKTEVIYNGVDAKKFRKVENNIKEKLGCEHMSTTVCRLIPQKGVEYLVRAVKEIEGNFKAVIIGRGPELVRLKALAEKIGVEKRIKFVSEIVPEPELIQYYSASDFFILPSLWEPFGIVLIEAMACENPIIATRAGGIPEVVSPDCGILVEPRNPKQIAEAANRLLSDEGLRKRLGKNARRRVEEIFDFDVIA